MIKIGNSNIVGVSLGNTQFSSIYKGVDLVWSKTPSLIQVNIEFREGVISMTVNGVRYTEPTTIYVEYKSTIEWSAEVQEGFEYVITSGEFNVNEKKVYYVNVSNPTNEIWYRTENNVPISLNEGGKIGNCFGEYNTLTSTFECISNNYDSSSGYCKIKFNKEIVNWNIYSNSYTSSFFYLYPVKSIDYIPESIEQIGSYFCGYKKFPQSINISNLPNLRVIYSYFYYNFYDTNYGSISDTITNFELGDMPQLESIGSSFIRVASASNYTINKITINRIKIGNTPKLKTIGDYFIGVNTSLGNYPEATLTIGSLELGDMSNVETIGDYFLGGMNSGSGTATINIDTITLPSMPKLKSVGTGAFANNKVKTIYVPSDCYDLYCEMFPNGKSKFVKIN